MNIVLDIYRKVLDTYIKVLDIYRKVLDIYRKVLALLSVTRRYYLTLNGNYNIQHAVPHKFCCPTNRLNRFKTKIR